MAWTWDITPAPAVGAKLTAAGFGAQVDGAVAELQAAVDTFTGGTAAAGASAAGTALLASSWARPGGAVPGLTTTKTDVTAGPTTILASPGSGRRVLKSLILSATASSTCQIIAAGSTIANLSLSANSVTGLDVVFPLTSSETVTATVSAGTVSCFASYGDRTDTTLDRLGMASSGTVVASGTARTVGQLWIGNASASVAATVSLTVGGKALLTSVPIAGGGVFSVDSAFAITNSEAISLTVSSGNAVCFVSGY